MSCNAGVSASDFATNIQQRDISTITKVPQPTMEEELRASHDLDWKPPHQVVSRGRLERCSVYFVIGRVCVIKTLPDASIAY